MTEIRIDNRPVAIGDTTFELVAYNPLADETADHTYDIDIDLSIPANAAALGHIGRLDRDLATAWGEYRSGAVLADGRTIISGRAYLLSIADGRAKVQIVAEDHARRYTEDDEEGGESAFARGSARIDTLLAHRSPQSYLEHNALEAWEYHAERFSSGGTKYKAPRLIDTLEALFDVMGLRVEYDVLKQNWFATSICIVSDSDSEIWGDHLPPWSVAYFVRQVEKFFNVQIIIDEPKAVVRIESLTSAVSETKDIEAFDDWELEVVDEDDGGDVISPYENVRYDFPDTRYYREADIDDDRLTSFKTQRRQSGQTIDDLRADSLHTIWEDTWPDGSVRGRFVIYGADGSNQAAAVMNYQHKGDYGAENATKLAIIPCETADVGILSNMGTGINYQSWPVVCHYDKDSLIPQDQTDYQIITGEGPEASGGMDNSQQMRVMTALSMSTQAEDIMYWNSFYKSLFGLDYDNPEDLYEDFPESLLYFTAAINGVFVYAAPYSINTADWVLGDYAYNTMAAGNPFTLSLDNLAREFRWGYNIETLRSRHRYKVRAQWPWTERLQQFRVRCRGKHFVIYSVKHTLTERGFDPVAEIEMYPIDD